MSPSRTPLDNCRKAGADGRASQGADGITVEANDKTVGFADADYLLYYSATDSSACGDGNGGTSDALAYASAFEVTECDKPLVGYIHFCPSGLSSIDLDSTQHATQLSTGAFTDMLHCTHCCAMHTVLYTLDIVFTTHWIYCSQTCCLLKLHTLCNACCSLHCSQLFSTHAVADNTHRAIQAAGC